MQDGSSPFLLPCGNSRVNDKKVNEENSKKMKKEAQECAGRRNVSKHPPLVGYKIITFAPKIQVFSEKNLPKTATDPYFWRNAQICWGFSQQSAGEQGSPACVTTSPAQSAWAFPICQGLNGLWHPADSSCLGRHAYLAGHCPNNSSLFRPLAAVVVVFYGGAVPEGDGEGEPAEKESLPLQPQAGVLRWY